MSHFPIPSFSSPWVVPLPGDEPRIAAPLVRETITVQEFKAWLEGFCEERERLDRDQIDRILSKLGDVGTVTEDAVSSFDTNQE